MIHFASLAFPNLQRSRIDGWYVRGDTAAASAAIICFLAFLVFNPFFALFMVALLSLGYRVPVLSFVVPAALSFTLFFYFREYGVEWYPGASTDDVPQYLGLYQSDYGIPLLEVFWRFVEQPYGHEPLWHLPLWALINEFDASEKTFIFLHYLVIFVGIFLALATLSRRYLAPLALVYFLLIPISLESIAFIWRQQLAFSLFVAGVGLLLVRHRKIGWLPMLASPFVHISSWFFVSLFAVYSVLRTYKIFQSKLGFSLVLAAVLLAMPALSIILIRLLDSLGLSRVMDYFLDSAGEDKLRVYLLMGGYAIPQLIAVYKLKNDDANKALVVICVAVFGVVLAIPSANAIYDRLLMFSLPLLAIQLFRCVMFNFSAGWRVPVLVAVFAIGVSREYGPGSQGNGPGAFLAFGHAFDPFMGIIKMLVTL